MATAISDTELHRLYGADYFHGGEYADYLREEDELKHNFEARLKTLLELTPSRRAARLLEIGCAYGFFLDLAQRYFTSVQGIDIAEKPVAWAREHLGVNALAGDFLTADLGEPFDIVCMWDTIEHLKAPDLYLARCAEIINPGGLLAITTGDAGSLNARLRGRKWRQIHPPTHLHYFSAATLSRLVDKYGFEIIHLQHPGTMRSLRMIFYIILALRLGKSGLFTLFDRLPLMNWRLSVNLGDLMFIVARRRTA